MTTVSLGLCSAWLSRGRSGFRKEFPLLNQQVRRRRPVRSVAGDSFKVRLCRVGCMMRAVTTLLSSPLACGGDVQLGDPADDVDVVVAGAGWAGMASAVHLRKAEVSFVVLEAQSHTGGRRHAFMFGHESVGCARRFLIAVGRVTRIVTLPMRCPKPSRTNPSWNPEGSCGTETPLTCLPMMRCQRPTNIRPISLGATRR